MHIIAALALVPASAAEVQVRLQVQTFHKVSKMLVAHTETQHLPKMAMLWRNTSSQISLLQHSQTPGWTTSIGQV